MLIFLSVLIVFVPLIFTSLLLRGRLKLNSWSTSDFLPLVACALLGIGIALAVEILLEQLFKIDKRILNTGLLSIRSAITVSVAMCSIQWYKSRT